MLYNIDNQQDTIVALATPQGVGAIGVIRLSGKNAIALCDEFFHGKKLNEQAANTIHFGTIRDEENRILDEVLVSLFKAPKSYTREDTIEISCHGSPFILQQVLQLFLRNGARMANAGEFTLRAFLNGQLDLSQAEAVADLIASSSEASHQVAMKQMRGGISLEIKKLREELITFASLIELELDFGEEDVEFADRTQLRLLMEKIQRYLNALLSSFQLGNAIKNGITTVIAGRPNAGKSTLLNVLLNEERAIVSEIAGTTRDTIEEVLNINGVEFRLIDTAGIREATDAIEKIGVAKTMEKIEQSSLLVYVFDVVETESHEVLEDLKQLYQEGQKVLVVANKMDWNPYFKIEDLINSVDINANATGSNTIDAIPISAKNNMNIDYLKEKLYGIAIDKKISEESVIVSNSRHYDALNKALSSMNDALHGLDNNITSDFIAMDIRRALSYLGEITGDVSVDDLLENIFSKFCIGK
jgi:tRNA modification GTPase